MLVATNVRIDCTLRPLLLPINKLSALPSVMTLPLSHYILRRCDSIGGVSLALLIDVGTARISVGLITAVAALVGMAGGSCVALVCVRVCPRVVRLRGVSLPGAAVRGLLAPDLDLLAALLPR